MNPTIKHKNGRMIRFETYLSTKAVQDEIIRYAKHEKRSKHTYSDDGEKTMRYAYFCRYQEKPVELLTQTSDGPVELYLTTIGWDDDYYTSGGDNSPYNRFNMYDIKNYY